MKPSEYKKFDGKKMIVKVQVPLATSDPEPKALVYNKDRSYDVFMFCDEDLMKAMKGEPKKFFHAHYDYETNNTVLEGEAEWQQW